MVEPSCAVDGARIAAASMDGVGVVRGTEYDFANDTLARTHGCDDAATLVGREWSEWYDRVGRGWAAAALLDRVRAEGDWRGRALARGREGERVPVELSMRAAGEAVVCVVRERAGRGRERGRGADPHGRRSDGRHRRLVDAAPVPAGVVAPDLGVVHCNPAAVELLGADRRRDVLGRDPAAFVHEDYRDRLDRARRALKRGTVVGPVACRLVGLDGRPRLAEVAAAPVADGESPAALVLLARASEDGTGRDQDRRCPVGLLDGLDDLLWVVDEGGDLVAWNERLNERLGYADEELAGMAPADLLFEGDGDPLSDSPTVDLVARDGARIPHELRRTTWHDGETGEAYRCVLARDVTDRLERERRLERRRDELDRRTRVDELVLAIVRELDEATSADHVESAVRSGLVDSELYRDARVIEPGSDGTEPGPRASPGVDDERPGGDPGGAVEPAGEGPVGRAFRTGRVRVDGGAADGPASGSGGEPPANRGRGCRSTAAVPLAYDGTTYGVAAVSTDRPLAFGAHERRSLEALGAAVGLAIRVRRADRLLHAESVSELEFELVDTGSVVVRAATELDCSLSLDGYVTTGDGGWLLYLAVDGDARALDRLEDDDRVRTVEPIGSRGDGREGQVVCLVAESSLLETIAAVGGRVTGAAAASGRGRVTVEVPRSVDVRRFVSEVRATHPEARFAARTDHERPVTTDVWLGDDRGPALTNRQRQALEAAHRAGYFEWPRDSTAEEVADLLGVTRPTLHAHLRKAERELVSAFLDAAGTGRSRPTGTRSPNGR